MNMFNYLPSKSTADLYEIFKVVQDLVPYAKYKYALNYEDVLDASFEHIVNNYDKSKGELKNYATKVVRTIGCSLNKKEVTSDEQTRISLDIKTAEEFINSPMSDDMDSDFKVDNVDDCVNDLIAFFVRDFKFFMTYNSKYRTLDYTEIRNRYSSSSILNAMKYLIDRYSSDIRKFITFSKESGIRNFSEDRYLKSMDASVEYRGTLNGTVLLSRRQGSHVKKVYKVCLSEVIDMILDVFYRDCEYGKVVIAGIPVYLTLSGKIVDSVEDLRSALERELVGSLLSRTSLKVVYYDRGNYMLFSSTRDVQGSVVLTLFGKSVDIGFERIIVKEV